MKRARTLPFSLSGLVEPVVGAVYRWPGTCRFTFMILPADSAGEYLYLTLDSEFQTQVGSVRGVGTFFVDAYERIA